MNETWTFSAIVEATKCILYILTNVFRRISFKGDHLNILAGKVMNHQNFTDQQSEWLQSTPISNLNALGQ